MDIERVREYTKKKAVIKSSQLSIDEIFLFEARNFLRLSIFNLLAYKHLMCSRYLAWGKVTLYYSYFYSISCLLRLAGHAVIHLTKPEDLLEPKDKNRIYSDTLTFQLVRNSNSHDYQMMPMRENEHKFVWNTFSTLYPALSTHITGQLTIEERIRWNYELLYPSQATAEFAISEARKYCENNFLSPDFGISYTAEEADHLENLIANYGYEEMYAGDLIKHAIKLFVAIAKSSNYKEDYVNFMKSVVEEVDHFESKQETKEEVKKWLQNVIEEMNR